MSQLDQILPGTALPLSRPARLVSTALGRWWRLPRPTGPVRVLRDVGAVADVPTEVFLKHRGNGPSGIVGSVHTSAHHPLDELPRTSTGKVRRLDLPDVLGLGGA